MSNNFPTAKNACLCCGQLLYKGGKERTIVELEIELMFLEHLGYTRHQLLTEHRDQLQYQLPGMVEWLTAQ